MAQEDEHRVENGVDDGAQQHADHGIAGAAVGADQVAGGVGHDQQRHTHGGDAGVGQGVGHHAVGAAEQPQQHGGKQFQQHHVAKAQHHHHGHGGAHHTAGGLLPAGAQIQVEVGGAAHADEQGDGQADGGQRIGHVGGGVAQVTHALADEDLVHDVVQGTHQHGQNAGNGKGRQQFGQRLAAQGIFSRHFQGPPSGFVPRRAGRRPAVESEGDAVFCGKRHLLPTAVYTQMTAGAIFPHPCRSPWTGVL